MKIRESRAGNELTLRIEKGASEQYARVELEHREALVGPMDDMWATFSDLGEHFVFFVNDHLVGSCSVNEDRELLSFFVRPEVANAKEIFNAVVDELAIVAACPSTVDPSFLSLCPDPGPAPEVVALMFRLEAEPVGPPLENLRLARIEDQGEATEFVKTATRMPRSFLEPYMKERIERDELFLHEEEGIVAIGECRNDSRTAGYAHLGAIVGSKNRNRGLGSRIMHALVLESKVRGLEPLCSTEPGNLAAVTMITRAGFIDRHRVLRVRLQAR